MEKEATYKEKFTTLSPWFPVIVDAIKRDLRNEHLKNDWAFVKFYFQGKNINKLTLEELVHAYKDSLEKGEKCEELGEFITNRWLLKNSDLYHFFEQELTKINPNFQEIKSIESKRAHEIMEKGSAEFGALNTYIFAILNSVVFPADVFAALEKKASHESKQKAVDEKQRHEQENIEAMQRNYEQQIARLTDKYEKKILGLEKKYHNDTQALKKQLSTLQKKLAGTH